ncbi:MAG: IS3 family transposase [Microcella pacifica]
MTFRLVRELAAEGVPAAVACRVLKVSESGYHAAKSRPPSRRDASDQALTSVLHEIHRDSRGTYGVRRVHAELRLGRHLAVGHGRVERLMRQAGLQGVHHRRWRRSGGFTARLGFGTESLRRWVRQAQVDAGARDGLTTNDLERIRKLERENRELREANAILRDAAVFFAGELDPRRR